MIDTLFTPFLSLREMDILLYNYIVCNRIRYKGRDSDLNAVLRLQPFT